jgi:hypothetical protein
MTNKYKKSKSFEWELLYSDLDKWFNGKQISRSESLFQYLCESYPFLNSNNRFSILMNKYREMVKRRELT